MIQKVRRGNKPPTLCRQVCKHADIRNHQKIISLLFKSEGFFKNY